MPKKNPAKTKHIFVTSFLLTKRKRKSRLRQSLSLKACLSEKACIWYISILKLNYVESAFLH